MAQQHTPGPWSYDPEINRVFSVPTNLCVAAPHILGNPAVMEMWPADAHLIAAAPDLLALANEYRKTVAYYINLDERSGDREGAALKRLTLALIAAQIAKAEGR